LSVRVGEAVPAALAGALVVPAEGSPVALGAYWAARPCVVLWLRHYGCVGCSEQVTELAPRLDELAGVGAGVVLVGSGTGDQRAAFVERHALGAAPVDVVGDEPLATYRAMGLARSLHAVFGPRALWEQARAMAAGHPHRGIAGDARQQGGALVVDRSGRVVLAHRNRSLGDHVSASDLVDAALRVSLSGRAVTV
jgi:peroxiredoxin